MNSEPQLSALLNQCLITAVTSSANCCPSSSRPAPPPPALPPPQVRATTSYFRPRPSSRAVFASVPRAANYDDDPAGQSCDFTACLGACDAERLVCAGSSPRVKGPAHFDCVSPRVCLCTAPGHGRFQALTLVLRGRDDVLCLF